MKRREAIKPIDKKRQAAAGQKTYIVPYDPLVRYIEEIKKYPALTREEEHKLAIRFWKYRDKEAAFILITSSLLMVVKLIMKFRTRQQNLFDLIQEGNIGLIEALKRFDPYREVRFSTYASWWVRAYVLKYLLDNWKMVKIATTNKKRMLFYNLKKEMSRLESMGIYPGPKLLAERLGANEGEVVEMAMNIEQADVSLDAEHDEDKGTSLIDMLAYDGVSTEDQTAREQFLRIINQKIEEFKKGLSEREKAILTERLLAEKPATLQDIADRFQKTKEAIRYTEKKLTDDLKAFMSREVSDLKLNLLSI
ncbi:sigma-70 family RNA polymerase sigma factor [bacterium]|nr:sigma-70 family RNA polymerase sigma factor [bacterium]